MRARIAVLASGGGSNLQAIFDHIDSLGDRAQADVALVASDRAASGALGRARERGVAAVALDVQSRTAGLQAVFDEHRIDLLALAGYLKFVPADVTRRFRGRIVNVHPALLPAFGGAGMYGDNVHRAVLESGVRVTGATVHFVDEQYDHGAIIAQWPVPVFADDTVASLGGRVLEAEHALYPRVVHAVAAGRIALDENNRVTGAYEHPAGHTGFVLARGASQLQIDALIA
jgi:phosphoribosylglycinamide formyltransferase-1